ncbi:hypothetical protein QIA20_04955 (plasmid) [Borreliella japonica]
MALILAGFEPNFDIGINVDFSCRLKKFNHYCAKIVKK